MWEHKFWNPNPAFWKQPDTEGYKADTSMQKTHLDAVTGWFKGILLASSEMRDKFLQMRFNDRQLVTLQIRLEYCSHVSQPTISHHVCSKKTKQNPNIWRTYCGEVPDLGVALLGIFCCHLLSEYILSWLLVYIQYFDPRFKCTVFTSLLWKPHKILKMMPLG